MDIDKLTISKHAEERYAERIMDKNNKVDMHIFILNNKDKIKIDILKMIEFGVYIYSGKSTCNYNNTTVEIYLNGTWVIIIDPNKNNVITLYSIDLGLGNDFNKEYINKLLDKLNIEKNNFIIAQEDIKNQSQIYTNNITDNENIIADYKKIIKSLEEQNEGYKQVISELKTKERIAEQGVRDVIAILIGKKVF